MRMTGSWVAVVTPYDADGQLNIPKFHELVDFHVEHGTSGLLLMGSTGESTVLSIEERRRIVDEVCPYADGKIPVFVGCTRSSTEATLEFARYAQDRDGVSGVLLVVPPYIRPPQDALYEFFATVAEGVDLPVAIYNNPSRVGVNIDAETMVALAELDNVVVDKEAIPEVSQLTEIKRRAGDDIDLLCCDYPGYSIVLPTLALGGTGTANVAGNIIPEEMEALSQPWRAFEDLVAARVRYHRLTPILELVYSVVNPVPVKAALNLYGMDVGEPRRPLPTMAGEKLAALEERLDQDGYLDKYGR